MSAKLLLTNFDGTMFRLEVLPDCRDTRVLLHTRYWNREDQLVPGELEFFGVAAVGFSVNYLDNPACMSWRMRRKRCGCCGRTLTVDAGTSF